MSISGVGSVNSYIYNRKTGKLSTKDGSHNEFVAYFNDDLNGEDSLALNGFDQQRKSGIKQMLSAAVRYTPEEISVFGRMYHPYKTTHPTGYDPIRNRLSIGVGNVFEFGNGYKFTVERDRVRVHLHLV